MTRLWTTLLAVVALLIAQIPAARSAERIEEAPSFVQDITIHAPLAEVWKVWTTSEGYKLLGVAQADVDFRIGGLIRSQYSRTGIIGDEETIENRILAYEPQRMIAMRINRPPKSFPFKEAWKSAWTVITLTELGQGLTQVRVASMGFGADEESVKMRKFFEAGNGATLRGLQKRLEASGPATTEPKNYD